MFFWTLFTGLFKNTGGDIYFLVCFLCFCSVFVFNHCVLCYWCSGFLVFVGLGLGVMLQCCAMCPVICTACAHAILSFSCLIFVLFRYFVCCFFRNWCASISSLLYSWLLFVIVVYLFWWFSFSGGLWVVFLLPCLVGRVHRFCLWLFAFGLVLVLVCCLVSLLCCMVVLLCCFYLLLLLCRFLCCWLFCFLGIVLFWFWVSFFYFLLVIGMG